MTTIKNSKGFTLIELLVVISIIGVLSAVVMSALNSARSKARDAQRSSSIKEVQTALEMYYHDNGKYPSSADVAFPGILTTALTPTYIPSIPTDPTNVLPYRYYTASLNPATFYAIRINYENKSACYVTVNPPSTGYWGLSRCQ